MAIQRWTDAEITTLADMAASGATAGQIGAALDRPRNSVIGKCHRLGVPLSRSPDASKRGGEATALKAKLARSAKAKPAEKPKPFRFGSPASLTPTPPKPVREVPMPSDATRVDLFGLTNITCRWPFEAEDGGFLFCGDPSADMTGGRSYCPYHARIARNAVQPSKRPNTRPARAVSDNARILEAAE